MATLLGRVPVPLASASPAGPLLTQHPPSPAVCPASLVPGGHTRATKLRVQGVKYSQMKQNAVHSGKIVPTFSDNAGLSIAFWMGDPDVPVGSSLQMLTKATRRGMEEYWKKNRNHSKKGS